MDMDIRVVKVKDIRGRRITGYKAEFWADPGDENPGPRLLVQGPQCDTPTLAKAALEQDIARWLDQTRSPIVMYDFCEPGTIWVAHQGWYGLWGYTIVRPAPESMPRGASHEGGGCGAFKTREEAVERMRFHWFQNGPEAVVRGILGLCTDQREWVCAQCASVQHSAPPYVCQAPRCGKVAA